MKILAATTSYPHANMPHAGHFVERWRNALEKKDHAIHFIRPRGSIGPRHDYQYAVAGPLLQGFGAPETLEKYRALGWLNAFTQSLQIANTVSKIKTRHELFVGHWLLPWGYIAPPFMPMHLYAHGSDVALLESMPKLIRTRIIKHIDRRASGLTFVSQNLTDRYQEILGRTSNVPITVCPMGIESDGIDETYEDEWKIRKGQKLLVSSIGRLVPIKGHDTLIRAASGLPNLILVIAGSGPEKVHLEALAQCLNVDVVFVGTVDSCMRNALLNQTDLFVVASKKLGCRQEGTPLSAMEALDMGCPCAFTKTGGLSALAERTGQFAFEDGDHVALRDEFRRFIQSRKYVTERRKRAHEERGMWGWSTCIEAHEQGLLNSLQHSAQPQERETPQTEVPKSYPEHTSRSIEPSP